MLQIVLNLPQRVVRSIKGRILNIKYFFKRYKILLCERKKWDFMAVHNCYIAQLPFAIPLICKPLKGKIQNHPNLLIVSNDNFKKKPITQKCCEYLGIKNYHRIPSTHSGPWRHNAKIVDLHRYLSSLEKLPTYTLYVDSDDVIFRDDPSRAIEILKQEGCKILFGGVTYLGAYDLMQEAKEAIHQEARRRQANPLYIDCGVFISETSFLLKILEEGLRFIDASDIPAVTYKEWYRDGTLCEKLSKHPKGFPYGSGCDQEIMRFLQSKYPNEMKADFYDRLAKRGIG